MKNSTLRKLWVSALLITGAAILTFVLRNEYINASSHREAPLIANDPLADNTDLYAFRSPHDTNNVVIIAGYVPAELPQGGPNYYSFGENVRYEIHIKNGHLPDPEKDDMIYRFTFRQENQDPSTFFNIRLGKQNLKTTYTCERSVNGGSTFQTVVSNGIVPPNNIGPRSIDGPVGLNTPYATLMQNAVTTATSGEKIFCGPVDDPFFVDLGGVFDLGQTRAGGSGVNAPKDGLACKNIHAIALEIPITTLQKDHKNTSQAANILDPNFVIGVWASASRQKVTILDENGGKPKTNGKWIQVSRIGMPLTNEVIMPIGKKDYWNSLRPYNEDVALQIYFTNPELALYMDNSLFGGAVPAFSALRVQRNSLQAFDFGNTKNGLAGLFGNPATIGTALDTALFGKFLLRPGQPRSVDLLPIFLTGVPNLPPYQLATGKGGNPLAAGKPFINNFLPTFGDMLRLNMAVPVTPRTDPNFSSLGLVQAAVLGLTNPAYNSSAALQFIPNMDGFPNGRRLEDDVTRIELQAVGGVVLAAIGLWYDDYVAGNPNPVTPNLVGVLNYMTGVESNDASFSNDFPYLAQPWSGYNGCNGSSMRTAIQPTNTGLNLSVPNILMQNYPNPASNQTTFKIRVSDKSKVAIRLYDGNGKFISVPFNEFKEPGMYETNVNVSGFVPGTYFATLSYNNETVQSIKFSVVR